MCVRSNFLPPSLVGANACESGSACKGSFGLEQRPISSGDQASQAPSPGEDGPVFSARFLQGCLGSALQGRAILSQSF